MDLIYAAVGLFALGFLVSLAGFGVGVALALVIYRRQETKRRRRASC